MVKFCQAGCVNREQQSIEVSIITISGSILWFYELYFLLRACHLIFVLHRSLSIGIYFFLESRSGCKGFFPFVC
jgi:hypothetical protein